jgi:hypothetical protein
MWPTRRKTYGYDDYRQRDARLQKLHSRLSLARLQRNKALCTELEQAIRKAGG